MKAHALAAAAALALTTLASHAHVAKYRVDFSGAAEAPPNASAGTGVGWVTFDLDLATMRVEGSFSGLTGNTTAAHIHCCIPDPPGTPVSGVATPVPSFPLFPTGVTSGSYDKTFDLTQASSYNASFVTANGGSVGTAMNALLAGAAAGKAYWNIHTSAFPGGEIRGFLAPVPEPATYGLTALGLLGIAGVLRRRRPI